MSIVSEQGQQTRQETALSHTLPIIIEPTRGLASLRLGDLWRARELVYFLAWRDVKVRYKQAVLGVGWAVLQPVINMIVFSVIFGGLAHLPSDGVPYPIFTFAALLPWTYFAYLLQQGGNSLVGNGAMLAKVYFPRLALPLSAVGSGLVDFCVASLVLVVLMLKYHIYPGIQLVFLPLFLLLAVVAGFGLALWLAALNVQYRDVRYVTPFLIQVGLYACPVAYSASVVTGKTAVVYALNPMATVIRGFRWSLLGLGNPPGLDVAPSIIIALLVLVTGLMYFRHVEQRFADVI
jgi:lipopolysaccharide transport system permease protein